MRNLISTAIAIFPVATWSACVAEGPVATAEWIFRKHHEFYVTRSKDVADFVSPSLLALLQLNWKCQSDGDLCALGSVPWTNAQDGGELEPIRFRLEASARDRTTVSMSYLFGWKDTENPKPVPTRTSVTLIREGALGCWKLDDLIPADGVSMRKQLERYEFNGP